MCAFVTVIYEFAALQTMCLQRCKECVEFAALQTMCLQRNKQSVVFAALQTMCAFITELLYVFAHKKNSSFRNGPVETRQPIEP